MAATGHRVTGIAVSVLLALGSLSAQGLTREEALRVIFPDAAVEAERVFLTGDQRAQVEARAGGPVSSALVARYLVRRSGRLVGRAYVDTHVVRTKRESLLIALDAEGRVRRIEVTAFLEPPEYQVPEAWLRQYEGRLLTDDLTIDRVIRPIAGATLTARATNEAVRRVLAIDAVLTVETPR